MWPFCAPGLLWRSLLAVLVLVPLAAVVLVEVLRPALIVRAGLVVSIFAVGVGPLDELKRARAASPVLAYELGLDVMLLIASVVFVPAAVALHGLVFHHQVHVGLSQVGTVVVANALLPLAVGRDLWRSALGAARVTSAPGRQSWSLA